MTFLREFGASHDYLFPYSLIEARALLVDKDNTPVWSPKTLSEVTDEFVMRYFNNTAKY